MSLAVVSLQFLLYSVPHIMFKWANCVIIQGNQEAGFGEHGGSFDWKNQLAMTSLSNNIFCSLISLEKISQLKNINFQKAKNFIFLGKTDEFLFLFSKIFSKSFNSLTSWYIIADSQNESESPQIVVKNWITLLQSQLPLNVNTQVYIGVFTNRSINIMEIFKVCSRCPTQIEIVCNINLYLYEQIDEETILDTECHQSDFYERRKNLQLFQFNAVSVNVLPFIAKFDRDKLENKNIVSGGLFGSIFLILLNQLNATYNVTVLHGYRYGAFINGSWNGVMGYLSRNDVDLSVSELSIVADRLSFIDYTASFDSVGRRIYVKKMIQEKNSINWEFFSAPFSSSVHLSTMICLCTMIIMLWLSDGYHCTTCKQHKTSLNEWIWVSLSFLCQKGSHIYPTHRTAKLTFIVFGITFLIIYCAYSAKLISQLSVAPPIALPFKDLKDFITNSKNWKGGPISGDLTQIYMEKTCPELLKNGQNSQCKLLVELWNKIVKQDKGNLPLSFQDGLKRVLTEKFAFIATSFGTRNEIENNLNEEDACSILEMDEDYISSNLAFGLRKDFPYKNILNYLILKLRSSGVIKRLKKYWLPQKKHCFQTQSFTDATIQDIGFALLIWLVGFIISVIILLSEYFIIGSLVVVRNRMV